MAAKKKKKKLTPIPKLKNMAAELFQKLRRLECADDNGYCSCVSCGKSDQWSNMQGGHFIPRGNSKTLLDPMNVNPQCEYCNAFGMKAYNAEKLYMEYLQGKYGAGAVSELISLIGVVHKWVRADLEGSIKDYNKRIKVELARIGA